MKKALLVDDFPDNIFFLQEVIEALGFEPMSVDNGEKAVHAVKADDFAVIFMDIEMPIMNGFEELRWLYRPFWQTER